MVKKTEKAEKAKAEKVKKIKKVKPEKVKKVKPVKEKRPTDKLADKTALTKFLQGVFGDAQKKILRKMWKRAQEINKLEAKYEAMSDEELKAQTAIFKEKVDKALKQAHTEEAKAEAEKANKKGKKAKKAKKKAPLSDAKILNEILPEVFAVAREASKRILGMRPYDVQLIGGMVLNMGAVAEMKTGEGKTLVAMLPAYLNALTGRGVHIVTVNDYLAQRDAGWNGPVYDFLGVSVGVIINEASFVYDAEYENEEHDDERFRHLRPATRKEAYNADITYGTNNEFGFDYLRDNMTSEVQYLRQRELNFAIVDEVDSILIDEARTPLIISAPAGDNPAAYYQFAKVASRLTPDDYVLDEKRRSVTLTDAGIEKVQDMLGVESLYSVKNTMMRGSVISSQLLVKRHIMPILPMVRTTNLVSTIYATT